MQRSNKQHGLFCSYVSRLKIWSLSQWQTDNTSLIVSMSVEMGGKDFPRGLRVIKNHRCDLYLPLSEPSLTCGGLAGCHSRSRRDKTHLPVSWVGFVHDDDRPASPGGERMLCVCYTALHTHLSGRMCSVPLISAETPSAKESLV